MDKNRAPRITIVGSFMTDLMSRSPRLPSPGETVMGGPFKMGPGGKGTNQAVTAARLGAEVNIVASLGNDEFGNMAYDTLSKEGIGVGFVKQVDGVSTGAALIIVDDSGGENMIVVAPGSNSFLGVDDVERAREVIESSDCVVMQLEIPLPTVEYCAALAHGAGARVVLDPAPAPNKPLGDELLHFVDVLTPNENEASLISGIEVTDLASAEQAARSLVNRGCGTVIITMGSSGVLAFDGNEVLHVPAFNVKAVDTTGAGDAFNGALAVSLTEAKDLHEACVFASAVAGISVTRIGTSVAIPHREEVCEFLRGKHLS